MATNEDGAEGTNNSGSSVALTNVRQDDQQEQNQQLDEDQQQPKSVDDEQLLQEQPGKHHAQPQEQETSKPQQGDQVQQLVEEPRQEPAELGKQQQQPEPEPKEQQQLQETPQEEVQQDKQQQEEQQQQQENPQQQHQEQQERPQEQQERPQEQQERPQEKQEQQQEQQQQHKEEEQQEDEEEQQEEQQQEEQQQQQKQEEQQDDEEEQQEEQQQEEQQDEQPQEEQQQQQQEQEQQQEALPQSSGQREADGSQPQARKEKSRLSKPAAASSPRLDFIPKPAEPPVDNLIPIRLDIEADGQRYKDVFTWNVDDQDTEIAPFVRRLVKDINLPIVFAHYIAQSMQAQIADYRATDNQRPSTEERVQMIKLDLRVNKTLIHDQFLWDVNNPDSDPEGFAKRFCEDLELEDPEIAPAIAVSIREQIHEINKQISSSGRDTRISKKVRRERGVDYSPSSNPPTTALNLMRRPNNKSSVLRRRNEWDSFEPVIEQLTDKEMEALYAREERSVRLKKQQAEKEDVFGSRYGRM